MEKQRAAEHFEQTDVETFKSEKLSFRFSFWQENLECTQNYIVIVHGKDLAVCTALMLGSKILTTF